MRQLPYAAVEGRFEGLNETRWAVIQPNLERLGDVADWLRLIEGPVTPVIEDAAFAATAAGLLPEGALDSDSWSVWTDAVKAETGAKGRALFMSLRQALTGTGTRPEMPCCCPARPRQDPCAAPGEAA